MAEPQNHQFWVRMGCPGFSRRILVLARPLSPIAGDTPESRTNTTYRVVVGRFVYLETSLDREKAARRLPEGPSQELAFFWRATEITTLSREMRVARALIHDRLNVPPPCARAF